MSRILILANSDIGLYKFRKELIMKLLKRHEVYISLPKGEYVSELQKKGCIFIETKIDRRGKNPFADLLLVNRYRKMLKKIKPDVVLTYTIKPNVYGGIASRIMKVPYISNVTGLGSAAENVGILQTITLNLYKIGLKNANCVFFQNVENQGLFIKKGIVKSNNRLIPGSGVNTDEYSLLEYPEGDTLNFLFIARIMKEKGIEQYLDAAKHFRRNESKTLFHVLGFCEEEYEEELQQLHAKGVIKYHGMQSDIKKFHRISHCTIHPTYYPEGMSNVLLESAASGRPIITTNRSGCREIVDDGINGYVVEPNDSENLIEKIERFMNLSYYERNEMGKAGRSKVKKEFDREIVIQAYMNEIERIK